MFAGPLSSGQVPIRRGASGKVLFRHGAGRHPAVVSKHITPRHYPHSNARFRVTAATLRNGDNSIQTPAMIDTGATGFAFIDENFVRQHKFLRYKLNPP